MNADLYISVDIEADGPIPGEYSMLSLGACAVDGLSRAPEVDGPELPAGTFYVELQPISSRFVPEALAVSGLDRERLAREGAPPAKGMADFSGWIGSLAGRDHRPVFVSFSTWDWSFVYYYLIRFTGSSPFGHSSLDIKSFYMGRCGGRWPNTSKRSIARSHPELLAGLGPHTHHALDDAKEQGELFRRLLAMKV